MPVDYVRQEVKDRMPQWTRIKDCLAGSDAVKARGETYLVKPNADDKSPENAARFAARLKRAVYYNVTKRTLLGLSGQVFSKDPSMELPASLAPLETDADGAGLPLAQLAKRCLDALLGYGRAGLLVDYPATAEVTTVQQQREQGVHPTVVFYEPWSIPNWRTAVRGNQMVLTLVVLAETYAEEDDGFELDLSPQLRELRLTDAGVVINIWRKAKQDAEWKIIETINPTDSAGKPLQAIPFVFLGSDRNSPDVNDSPILDLVDLNLSHYNSSADYEDSSYLIGQPMYVFSGLTQQWVDDVLGGTIRVGSAAGLPLPVNAKGEILQPDPNTMAKEAMVAKEEQMRALGAKLVEPSTVQRTATEMVVEEATETSILKTAAKNVGMGIVEALRFAALFAGETQVTDESLAYELNTDFAASRMSPQERQQLIAEWQGGAMTFLEMRWNLRRAGLVYQDDEEAREEIAAELPPLDPDPNADPNAE